MAVQFCGLNIPNSAISIHFLQHRPLTTRHPAAALALAHLPSSPTIQASLCFIDCMLCTPNNLVPFAWYLGTVSFAGD